MPSVSANRSWATTGKMWVSLEPFACCRAKINGTGTSMDRCFSTAGNLRPPLRLVAKVFLTGPSIAPQVQESVPCVPSILMPLKASSIDRATSCSAPRERQGRSLPIVIQFPVPMCTRQATVIVPRRTSSCRSARSKRATGQASRRWQRKGQACPVNTDRKRNELQP